MNEERPQVSSRTGSGRAGRERGKLIAHTSLFGFPHVLYTGCLLSRVTFIEGPSQMNAIIKKKKKKNCTTAALYKLMEK